MQSKLNDGKEVKMGSPKHVLKRSKKRLSVADVVRGENPFIKMETCPGRIQQLFGCHDVVSAEPVRRRMLLYSQLLVQNAPAIGPALIVSSSWW